jgi:hypothetical protein
MIQTIELERHWDDVRGEDCYEPLPIGIDIGGFGLIKRTGEIDRMRRCDE